MTKIFLIRHGSTEWNSQKRYCGQRDVPLNAHGRSQVKKLAGRLRKVRFDRIYCSTKKRALQTARILFKGEDVLLDHSLREISFGAIEGLRHDEIIRRHGEAYKKWIKDPCGSRMPGAETMKSFKKRVESAMNRIMRVNPGKTVAVVCHGGVIAVLLHATRKRGRFWAFIPSSASLTVVERRGKRMVLRKFNDTEHLKEGDE